MTGLSVRCESGGGKKYDLFPLPLPPLLTPLHSNPPPPPLSGRRLRLLNDWCSCSSSRVSKAACYGLHHSAGLSASHTRDVRLSASSSLFLPAPPSLPRVSPALPGLCITLCSLCLTCFCHPLRLLVVRFPSDVAAWLAWEVVS